MSLAFAKQMFIKSAILCMCHKNLTWRTLEINYIKNSGMNLLNLPELMHENHW